ncbi:MAG: hypothetical protein KatS3mg129_3323 [Leptospiraceae bacterium]|nr:MAG: hypothetical protein KatS3mg129_0210 [Leptospiraceae bacterium]GIX43590.1 MAG: hypothetical protein KatS3mg129_3323 [Leptospiraceae bacterium]
MEFKRKIWNLEEARKIFPQIYKITEEYYNKVEFLRKQLETILPENEQEKIEEEISKLIQLWAIQMFDFGVEVKGLWLVDFDNGKGYYCWKYNEPDILYEHDYFSGFKGRKLIKE